MNPYGINFEGLRYDSPDLHPLRGRQSGLKGAATASGKSATTRPPEHHLAARSRCRYVDRSAVDSRETSPAVLHDVLKAAQAALDRRDETTPRRCWKASTASRPTVHATGEGTPRGTPLCPRNPAHPEDASATDDAHPDDDGRLGSPDRTTLPPRPRRTRRLN